MKHEPITHHRRSIRLKGYDYSQPGAYYVTIVTHNRACLFAEVTDGETRLNESGQIAVSCWQDIARNFRNVTLDEFVVMPNHIHGIIVIGDASRVGAKHLNFRNASPLPRPQRPHGAKSNSLGAIIQNFKSVTARRVNALRDTQGAPLWQRNYWEHVVRNEDDLNRIREYIVNNPANWQSDENNPHSVR